jgi:biotin carboxyl carrier protein
MYIVEVNGHRYAVELREGEAIVDGRAHRAAVQEVGGTPLRIVVVDAAVHRVIVRGREGRGHYRLWLDGHRYDAEALDSRTRAIRDLQAAGTRVAGPAPLVAPMPGLIVQLRVAVGDSIAAGAGMVVMEAMKMENELRAAAAGRVRAIHVAAGDVVEKGTLLVELE